MIHFHVLRSAAQSNLNISTSGPKPNCHPPPSSQPGPQGGPPSPVEGKPGPCFPLLFTSFLSPISPWCVGGSEQAQSKRANIFM